MAIGEDHLKKSGYLNTNKTNSNSSLFYEFYGARNEKDHQKLN